MNIKILEIRDSGTFIPLLCVDMNPGPNTEPAQRYYLRRCGYPCDGRPNIGVTHLSADGLPFCNDPYRWGNRGRTMMLAHDYIINNWNDLKDGDVVDVEFIMGLSTVKKTSERLSVDF